MIKTALGAQRYNNKMDKVWQQAKEAQEKTEFYQRVYKHLMKTGQEFCFTKQHGLVSREDCTSWLSFNI